jgi:RNA polymerase sigma factor (sigma-70 family)
MIVSQDHDITYQLYYQEVGKYSTLTKEEEISLFKEYNKCKHCATVYPDTVLRTNCPNCALSIPEEQKALTGTYACTKCSIKFTLAMVPLHCPYCGAPRNLHARDKIITSNLRFVVRKVRHLTNDPTRRDILISAGNVGLMLAVDKYKLEKGHRFLTYAEWWIRKEMYDAINNASLIRIPIQKRKALLKELRDDHYECTTCGLKITFDQLDSCNLPKCTDSEHSFELTTLNTNSQLGNGVSLDSITGLAIDDINPSEAQEINERAEVVTKMLKSHLLSERDLYIMHGYYDLAPSLDRKTGPKHLHQLAAMLNITPERVRQLKAIALTKVKRALQHDLKINLQNHEDRI